LFVPGGRIEAMSQPKPSELQRFNTALRSVLQVSKSDLNQMLEAEKLANAGKPKRGPKPKTSASGHAASDRG
jgi:hypothetical protein